jgi:hypothetical protein
MLASVGQRTVKGRSHGTAASADWRGFSHVDLLTDHQRGSGGTASPIAVVSRLGRPADGTDPRAHSPRHPLRVIGRCRVIFYPPAHNFTVEILAAEGDDDPR